MEKLADQGDSSRTWFRLALVAAVILGIAVMVAIVYGAIRLALGPVLARYYYSRGYSLAMKRNYDRAIADFSEAIRLDPTYNDAYFARGYTYNEKKQFDLAIADYTAAIKLSPKNASAYVNRGGAYTEKQDFDHAIADYTTAVRLVPADAESYYGTGRPSSERNGWTRPLPITIRPFSSTQITPLRSTGEALHGGRKKATRPSPITAKPSGLIPSWPMPTSIVASPIAA